MKNQELFSRPEDTHGHASDAAAAEPHPAPGGRSYEATERTIHRAFLVALLCLGAIGVVAHRSVIHLREDTRRVNHTQLVLSRIEAFSAAASDLQNGVRGYAITGDEKYLTGAAQSARAIADGVVLLRSLTADNPEQQRRLQRLDEQAGAFLGFSGALIETRERHGLDAARSLIFSRQGEEFRQTLRRELDAMRSDEHQLLAQREERARRTATLTDGVIIVGSVLAVVLVGTASAAIRRDLTGRRQAEDALRLSEENLAAALHSVDDAVIATDAGGRISHFNGAAAQLTGWPETQALGQPLPRVLRLLDTATGAPLEVPADVRMANTVSYPAHRTAVEGRDGTLRPIAERVTGIVHAGRLAGNLWVLREQPKADVARGRAEGRRSS